MKNYLVFSMAALLVGASCNTKQEKAAEGFTGAPGEVKLITLDPGHFHASLLPCRISAESVLSASF